MKKVFLFLFFSIIEIFANAPCVTCNSGYYQKLEETVIDEYGYADGTITNSTDLGTEDAWIANKLLDNGNSCSSSGNWGYYYTNVTTASKVTQNSTSAYMTYYTTVIREKFFCRANPCDEGMEPNNDGICQCNDDLVPNDSGPGCVVPHPPLDCEDHYSDNNGTCMPDNPDDIDNDGIPNNEDPDIDGDGIPNNQDPDIDGDGIPNDSDPFPSGGDGGSSCPDTLNCVVSSDNGNGTWNNTYDVIDCNGVNYSTRGFDEDFNCFDSKPKDNCTAKDVNSHTLSTGGCGCNIGYEYNSFSKCIVSDSPPEDDECNYPLENNQFPYRGLSSQAQCISDINFYAYGQGSFSKNDSCTWGACYYKLDQLPPENNNTDSNPDPTAGDLDNNSTTGESVVDANGTTTVDYSPITNRIDLTNNFLDSSLKKLDKLDSSIKNSSLSLGEKLNNINTQSIINANTLGQKLDQLKNSNAANLGGVKSAINNIDFNDNGIIEAVNNTNESLGDKLDKIADLLEQESNNTSDDNSTEDEKDYDSEFNQLDTMLSNTLSSFENSRLDIVNLANGFSPPVFSTNGSCLLSTVIFGTKSFILDLSDFQILRPFIQFILNLILLFLTLKFYVLIARDIVKYFMGGL